MDDELNLIALRHDLPGRPIAFTGSSPLLSALWDNALSDVERSYCLENEFGRTFAAGGYGKNWVGLTFNRDTSLSGLLALNALFPEEMLTSMKTIRASRLKLGWACYPDRVIEGVPGVEVCDMDLTAFKARFHKASSINKTDDVVWIWCMYDLLARGELPEAEWRWTYETALECFSRFYDPLFDPADGLYFGQALFIDVGLSGYPDGWCEYDQASCNRCVWIKAASTNALYVKAMRCLGEIARRLGREGEAEDWEARARALRQAMRTHLRFADGTYAYFRHRTGELEPRRDVLGTALCVLLDIAAPEEAADALGGYPVTAYGAPLIHPFYERDDRPYHNHAAWPFADTFLLLAYEKATGRSYADLNLQIMVNSVRDGSLGEVRNLVTNRIMGANAQLWTIAGFLNACVRAGLTELPPETVDMN